MPLCLPWPRCDWTRRPISHGLPLQSLDALARLDGPWRLKNAGCRSAAGNERRVDHRELGRSCICHGAVLGLGSVGAWSQGVNQVRHASLL